MNQLSWLLYLADFVSTLRTVSIITAIISAITAALCLTGSLIYDGASTYDADQVVRARFKSTVGPSILIFAIFCFLTVLCPTRNTMYAIAASQLGEQVLKTPVAGKAEKALESWLDKQIADNTRSDDQKRN